MAWQGWLVGIGVVLVVAGVLAVVAGLALAIVGPDAVQDAADAGRGSGSDGLLTLGGGDDPSSEDVARAKMQARVLGGLVAAGGAVGAVVGAIVYGVGRGASVRAPAGR